MCCLSVLLALPRTPDQAPADTEASNKRDGSPRPTVCWAVDPHCAPEAKGIGVHAPKEGGSGEEGVPGSTLNSQAAVIPLWLHLSLSEHRTKIEDGKSVG